MRKNRWNTFGLLAAALTVACWSIAPTTALAGGGNKGKDHKLHGKVVSVSAPVNGVVTITIEHHKHNKKGAPAANAAPEVVTKMVQVNATTQFEVVTDAGTQPATLAAVTPGVHVVIEAKGGVAETVAIEQHKHHKGNAKPAA